MQQSLQLADIISLMFHPFVWVFFSLVFVFSREYSSIPNSTFAISLILVLAGVVPTTFLWIQRKRGLVSNVYITDKRQRFQFGIFMVLMLLPILILTLRAPSIPSTVRLVAYFFVINGLFYMTLLHLVKVSAHIGVITSVAIGLSLAYDTSFLWLTVLIVPVAWARYRLQHHSLLELALGFIISVVSALIVWTIITVIG